MNRYSKKDNNHDALCKAFVKLGCSVAELHNAGIAGWPDLVVGCMGVNHLVEVKNPDTRYGQAGLNTNQQAFNRDWRGKPAEVTTSIHDVSALVAGWRKPSKGTP